MHQAVHQITDKGACLGIVESIRPFLIFALKLAKGVTQDERFR